MLSDGVVNAIFILFLISVTILLFIKTFFFFFFNFNTLGRKTKKVSYVTSFWQIKLVLYIKLYDSIGYFLTAILGEGIVGL